MSSGELLTIMHDPSKQSQSAHLRRNSEEPFPKFLPPARDEALEPHLEGNLAGTAQGLPEGPDMTAVLEALADRLRLLLHTRLVSVLVRHEGPFELRAVSAETPQLAKSFRAGHDRQTIRFAADVAQ